MYQSVSFVGNENMEISPQIVTYKFNKFFKDKNVKIIKTFCHLDKYVYILTVIYETNDKSDWELEEEINNIQVQRR